MGYGVLAYVVMGYGVVGYGVLGYGVVGYGVVSTTGLCLLISLSNLASEYNDLTLFGRIHHILDNRPHVIDTGLSESVFPEFCTCSMTNVKLF